MKKNVINKLAEASYVKSKLDPKKVSTVAKSLKRTDLKIYIKDLKNIEAKNTVTVSIPDDDSIKDMKNYFSKIYPDKRIVINIDSSLLTGIRVVDYDNVYELSLKTFLENSLRSNTND